jgi:hypothetical protein
MFFEIEPPGAEIEFYVCVKELEFFIGKDNIPEEAERIGD